MRRVVVPAAIAVVASFLPASIAEAAAVCDVSGKVVEADGDAVPGVQVWFEGKSGRAVEKTAGNGTYALRTACGNADVVISWRDRPGTGLPTAARISGEARMTDNGRFVFRLPPAVHAKVKVVDPAGKPVANAWVHPTEETRPFVAQNAKVLDGAAAFEVSVDMEGVGVRTDANGKAAFLTFPDRDMALTVRPPAPTKLEWADVVLDARKSGTTQVVVSTTPSGLPVTGVVRDASGTPVPGLTVGTMGGMRSRTTDAEGRFTVYSRTAVAELWANSRGENDPTALLPGLPLDFGVGPIKVRAGSPTPVEITLPPTVHVRFNFRDFGSCCLSTYVTLGDSGHDIQSDPAVLVPGTATVSVPVGTNYLLVAAQAKEFDLFRTTALTGMRASWTNKDGDEQVLDLGPLDASADRTFDIELPKAPPKHVVTGTLTDANGKPLPPGIRLHSLNQYAVVGADGRFSISLREGRPNIWLERSDYIDGWVHDEVWPDSFSLNIPVAVSAPADITLRLPRLHEVSIRALDPDERKPVKGAKLVRHDMFQYSGLTVGGAAGPVSGSISLNEEPTNAAGETVMRTFTLTSADVQLWGRHDGADLRSEMLDLEVTGDKALTLVLGTSERPTRYERPSAVSEVTAEGGAVATAAVSSARAASGTSATVRWKAPAKTGGMKVQGYQLTASPGGKTVRVGFKARRATVAGLTPGTAYSFTVRAFNAIGRARGASARLDVAAPRITALTGAVRGGTVKVAWKATDDASGIAGYDVRVRSGKGRWSAVVKNGPGRVYRFSLEPGTSVCVSVRARDRVGHVGAWSAPRCLPR